MTEALKVYNLANIREEKITLINTDYLLVILKLATSDQINATDSQSKLQRK